jgi:2-hydroxy-3-keto-5-methylthiopentenyl-1-phosphate phosphatase
LSDNFDYIIKRILKNNDIGDGIRLYSNALKLLGERTIPSFPLSNKRCGTCGNCKKDVLLSNNNGHLSVYVGDGLSDVHPSRHADIVFAKDSLLKYYKEKELPCIKYKNLKEVYGFIKRLPDGGKEH